MTQGRSIRMFLVDGSPSGVRTAEIGNWTGFAVMAPRTKIADLVQRPEIVQATGVYFLTGPDPDAPGKTLAYIGESDNVAGRLKEHNKVPKFDWNLACAVVSKDQNLTKAHGLYLESQLIARAEKAGRNDLVNKQSKPYGFLPEADIADMNYFLDQIAILLPVLGLELLKPAPQISVESLEASTATEAPVFELVSKKHGIQAEAQEIDGEFVVAAGSMAQGEWIGQGSEGTSYGKLHAELVESGKLSMATDGSGIRFFQQAVAFASPSAAAAVVCGRPANGRIEWKIKGTKKTYADWQTASSEITSKGDAS